MLYLRLNCPCIDLAALGSGKHMRGTIVRRQGEIVKEDESCSIDIQFITCSHIECVIYHKAVDS